MIESGTYQAEQTMPFTEFKDSGGMGYVQLFFSVVGCTASYEWPYGTIKQLMYAHVHADERKASTGVVVAYSPTGISMLDPANGCDKNNPKESGHNTIQLQFMLVRQDLPVTIKLDNGNEFQITENIHSQSWPITSGGVENG